MSQRANNRQSLLLPIVIPLGSLALIAVVLWLFSRVLLDVSPTAATAMASAVGAGVLAVGAYVASRTRLAGPALYSFAGGVVGVVFVEGGVALLVGQPGEEGGEAPVVLAIAAPVGADTAGYDRGELLAPAGVPFDIAFDNQDAGVLHNLALAEEAGGDAFFEGPLITGPVLTTYTVDPLAVGQFAFFCTVHPTTMTGTLTAAESVEPSGGVTLVAEALAFSTDTIELPPDVPNQVVLENRDADPHNLAIYEDSSLASALFNGEIFAGPATKPNDIPALAAGTYYFQCDTHPTMNGQVIVAAGAEGAPPPGEAAPPGEGGG